MPLCFNLIACSSGDNNAVSVDVNCVTGSILGKAEAAATGSGLVSPRAVPAQALPRAHPQKQRGVQCLF